MVYRSGRAVVHLGKTIFPPRKRNPDMKILAVDTSSKICSVCILEDNNILIEKHNDLLNVLKSYISHIPHAWRIEGLRKQGNIVGEDEEYGHVRQEPQGLCELRRSRSREALQLCEEPRRKSDR